MSGERATRGRPSRIEQLPEDIKTKLDELLRSGITQKEILDRLEQPLREIGEEPLSRSGLNRYTTRMEAVGRRIRETRAIADAWTANLGEKPVSNTSAMAIEVLKSLAFRAAARADETDEETEETDSALIGDLALAIQRLERSANLSVARERELRKAFAAEAEEAVRDQGISGDTAAAIRKALTTT